MGFVRRPCAAGISRGLAVLSAFVFVGCRQTSSEYVEAELRVQSRKVAELENRLCEREAEIETLQYTVTTFQAAHVKPTEAPETVYRDTALSRITLTLATGAKDADLDGKDDGVVVGVAPHDYDGDVFKCPGSCRLQLFETSPAGVRKPIGDWSVSSEQLRGLWRASILGQGYHLTFGWQTPPIERKLRAVVTFLTVDGRKFEAEKDFEVSIQPKSPPKLPGARIDAEPPPGSPAPAIQTMNDLPKPPGLGALSRSATVVQPGRNPPPRPTAKVSTAMSSAAPPSPRDSKSPIKLPMPVVLDPNHSHPPLVDRERFAATANKATPGDLADAEDVIVLPAATTKSSADRKAVDKPPTKSAAPPVPSVAKPTPERIVLPDEPAPPRSILNWPQTIPLPN